MSNFAYFNLGFIDINLFSVILYVKGKEYYVFLALSLRKSLQDKVSSCINSRFEIIPTLMRLASEEISSDDIIITESKRVTQKKISDTLGERVSMISLYNEDEDNGLWPLASFDSTVYLPYSFSDEQFQLAVEKATYNALVSETAADIIVGSSEIMRKTRNIIEKAMKSELPVHIIGETGTGKTLLARTLAKKLDVPFAIADATTLTEAGYVGEDVENILLKLIEAADFDISKAEHGIIFIDEIDKISKKGENVSITRDVSGEGVQQALLKIIEGTVASVPPQGGRKHPNQEMLKIDTSNILFICGGAFVGLDKIIEKRVAVSAMGFGAEVVKSEEKNLESLYQELHPDDLIKFGLIPEFIGRLPVHVTLNNLTESDLRRIITEPKNSILRQYETSFSLDGIKLTFTDDAINAIAEKAYKEKTGARGLRSIVENLMLGISYEIPSMTGVQEVIVDRENVEKRTEPRIIRNDGKYIPAM